MSYDILEAVPQSWISWDFKILRDSKPIAHTRLSRWWKKGELTILGVPYRVHLEHPFKGPFLLEAEGSILAGAEKPNALFRLLVIEQGERRLVLKARSALRREFFLLEGPAQIGLIQPAGFFTRRAIAALAKDLTLPVKVFVVFLTLLLWMGDGDGPDLSITAAPAANAWPSG